MKAGASIRRLLSSYGMLLVLLLLAAFFSAATVREQTPEGASAARAILKSLPREIPGSARYLVAARGSEEDAEFVRTLTAELRRRGVSSLETAAGDPALLRRRIEAIAAAGGGSPPVVLTPRSYAAVVRGILADFPPLAQAEIRTPASYRWPTFLLRDNIRNIANQISVIAILAVGMTMVIITGGIDLSVGSLVALAAVACAGLIAPMGGAGAGTGAILLAGAGAVLLCGLFGIFSGFTITRFGVPPFIATLGMMQVASGIAYILSKGKPIYQVPDSFVTLGRGADPLLGVPYAVILMAALFLAAHLLMSRTILGRHIYAVGGNAEAARLAGVPVRRVLLFVYTLTGMLAGLGGVVMASQLKSGAPTYGLMYELYVIAAVVVGGTSLSGGEGKILGTLIGAFIIAVIQNGMNLTNVESYTQKVVLGLVILGAVLLDRLKHRGLLGFRRKAREDDREERS